MALDVVLAWLPILVAPFVGSFAGLLVRRLPRGGPIAWARSRCEACDHALAVPDLVPVASFLALRGRCRFCAAPIAPMHLAIELAALAVAITAALAPEPALVWSGCALGWTLLALAWIDAEHLWLPDTLTLPLLLAGLASTAWLAPDATADHAIAAAVSYLGMRGLGAAYRRLRGRPGLGQGDAKLLAASGAWLGLAAMPWVLLLAALAGILWLMVVRWRGGPALRATTILPFGPAIALATWLSWIVSVTEISPSH